MEKIFISYLLSLGFIIIASEKPHGQKRSAESEAPSSEKKTFVPSNSYAFAPKSGQDNNSTSSSSTVQQPTQISQGHVASQISSTTSSSQPTQQSSYQILRWAKGGIVDFHDLRIQLTRTKPNFLKDIEQVIKEADDIKLLKTKYNASKHNIKIIKDFLLKEKESLQKTLNNIESNLENINIASNELPVIVQKKANQFIEEQKNIALELGRPRTPEPKPKE